MPSIRLHPDFPDRHRKFVKGNAKVKKLVDKTFSLFRTDPRHPSLAIEKLRGTGIWTIRVDRGNRIFFVWSKTGDTAIFFFIGPHDSYRKF